jgi:cytochrome c-type biogenesis protein CcmI
MSFPVAAMFIVFAATLIAFTLWPLRRPSPGIDRAAESLAARELVRDQKLHALRELELDRSTGVLSDEAYEESVVELRREAIDALAALEEAAAATRPRGTPGTPRRTRGSR